MINKTIFALSFLIIFLSPVFCFAQELSMIRPPQTLEESWGWIKSFLNDIPFLIKDLWQKEVWPAIFKVLNWLKVKIWDEFYSEYFREYTKFAVPMAIASASYIIMTNIDKVFIQLFWSAQQVGEYFAIFNLSRFLLLFSSAVGMLLFPTISEYHSKNNVKKIMKVTEDSERYLSMIIFPVVIIMVVLAEPTIRVLLSRKYMSALPVLQILPFFVLLYALIRPYATQLAGMNMPHIERNRVFIMALTNVVLNLILIPRDIKSLGVKLFGLGTEGAAVATVIAYFVGLSYIRIMAWKINGARGNHRIILHAVAAMFMGLVLWYINRQIYVARWYHLVSVSMFGIAIYFAILFIMQEFKKEDFDLFMDTLNVKKMLVYIKEEIKGK